LKLLIDMNLSPTWVEALRTMGFEAVHWSSVGDPRAPDREILGYASSQGYVIFTNGLDFGAILAASAARHNKGRGFGEQRGLDQGPLLA
jgi:predicted nuclease of predicted toxin-antitoxin system